MLAMVLVLICWCSPPLEVPAGPSLDSPVAHAQGVPARVSGGSNRPDEPAPPSGSLPTDRRDEFEPVDDYEIPGPAVPAAAELRPLILSPQLFLLSLDSDASSDQSRSPRLRC